MWSFKQLPSEPGSIGQNFLISSQKHTQHSFLDVLVAMDGGGQWARQDLKHVLKSPR